MHCRFHSFFKLNRLTKRWRGQGGYREVLKMALPLILSTGAWSIQHFVDRMFLAWLSPDAVAASMPAGMISFTFVSLFIGDAGYTNVFVAQYTGADRPSRVGPAVWQGLYFSLIAGVLAVGLQPLAEPLFALAGHSPAVQVMEVQYFRILICGAGFAVGSTAASCFFTGRGKTITVMWVIFFATMVNLTLDYLWIFGHWGFPAMGITGAGLATVVSSVVSCVLFLSLMLRRANRKQFNTFGGRHFDRKLFVRMLRFGLPSGMQFMLEMLGFSIFVLLVGRLGVTALAATNIAFNINTLAFMPMIGLATAVSTLVGQKLGQNRPRVAEKIAFSAFHLTFLYMTTIAVAYVLLPDLFLRPFKFRADPQQFEPIYATTVILLRFLAVVCVFDSMSIIFSAAIKGAGDTRFVMIASVAFSWTIMVIPAYLSCVVFNWGLYVMWCWLTLYISVIGFVFLWRFMGGKWKSMRVIEPLPAKPPTTLPPDAPTPEAEP